MSKPKKQKFFYISLLLIATVTFFLTAALASSKGMADWEKELLVDIYNTPPVLHWFALVVTQFGSAWMLVGLSIWLLIGHKRDQHKGGVVLVSGLITYTLVEFFKNLIARPRPAELLTGLLQREPLVTGFGFPSGHTALATVISLVFVQYLPATWRLLPILWIGLVAWSRVYLGVHAPIDIIGGLALGLMIVSGQRFLRVR